MSADPLRPDLTGFRRRLAELEGLLADPATFADNRRAAALGADYIAPYLGRITDLGRDGHAELTRMQRIVEGVARPVQAGAALRLLVASLRSAEDLARLAAEGLDTFTISPAIAAELFAVEPTLAAADQFELDALGI